MDAKFKMSWDHEGWKKYTSSILQRDWNQTVITAINQLSAQINMSTLQGPANKVKVSLELFQLILELEYTKEMGGRYFLNDKEVIVDTYQKGNMLYVYNDNHSVEPKALNPKTPNEFWIMSNSPNLEQIHEDYKKYTTKELRIIDSNKLVGEITVENYV